MKEKTKENTNQKSKPLSDAADKAMKNYEQAVRTGLKLQEEATHLWTNLLNQGASPQEFQKRFTNATAITNGVLPVAQKTLDDVLNLFEQNTKAGTELLKKAADVCQTSTVSEYQTKCLNLCTASVDFARSNIEAVTEINSRALDSWINYVRKSADVTEVHTPKTA